MKVCPSTTVQECGTGAKSFKEHSKALVLDMLAKAENSSKVIVMRVMK